VGHARAEGRGVNALHAFRTLIAAGCRFEIAETEDGDVVLGIHGDLSVRLQRLVENDPEGLAAVVAEHLGDMVPGLVAATPAMVHFVRAKDGLVARWRTESGKVKMSEVADPDRKRRGRNDGKE